MNDCVCKAIEKDLQILSRHREKTVLHKVGVTLSLPSEPVNYYDVKLVEV